MNLLEKINSPEDLKSLSLKELPQLCEEIRQYLLDTISQTGGHLASNLGTVELTVAMHYVYDSPQDQFVWDVGHQTYTHKILTGRKKKLHTVRMTNGLSGFPKITESEHDTYETGHAGTSISQALGENIASQLQKKNNQTIAVIGDASIVSGIAFEAMNHVGYLKTPFLVILNDNEMSISRNVGALSYSLSKFRTNRLYKKWRSRMLQLVRWTPFVGPIIEKLIFRFRSSIKSILMETQFFEELGFRYLGPLDGHDVKKLVKTFRQLRRVDEPTLLHIVTVKGKGYERAEKDPITYHGVQPFDFKEGMKSGSSAVWGLSKFVGKTLSTLADIDDQVVAITPAMIEGSGLQPMETNHPKRTFDTGIAEQHATAFAGALSKAGTKAYLCIYSTFLQRGYDQLIHDIALMNLPVKLILDRTGCVGGDGQTHQGLYDISFLSVVPNMEILSPFNAQDLVNMIAGIRNRKNPVAIRVPKLSADSRFFNKWQKKYRINPIKIEKNKFSLKKLTSGNHGLLLCEGFMANQGIEAAKKLSLKGIEIEVIALRSINPLDWANLKGKIKNHFHIFSIENHYIRGGVGDKIQAEMADYDLPFKKVIKLGYPNKPIPHGKISDIEERFGLNAASIAKYIEKVIRSNPTSS